MAQNTQHSAVPVYLTGLSWIVYALIFPLYRPLHYVACAAVSVFVYILARGIFPDRAVPAAGEQQQEEPPARKPAAAPTQQTKEQVSPEVQNLLKERDRALSEMRRLNDAIDDPKISAQIDHLEDVTAKILNLVAAKPEKLPQIQRFMDYYLPTTLKILNAYDRMTSAGISGSNIDATKSKVENMMDTIVTAYDRQLDALFGDEAMDISTDITVMENLLAQEGLGGTAASGTTEDNITLTL